MAGIRSHPRSSVSLSRQYLKEWLEARMEALEADHALHIPFNLSSREAEFLPLQEAWHQASPASLPPAATIMSVKGPAYSWLLANLALAHAQEGIHARNAASTPVTAGWAGPTMGAQVGTANAHAPDAVTVGYTLGTSQDPNHIKADLAATSVLPRDLGTGTFVCLTQGKATRNYDAGYVAGWLGFLTTAILLLAGTISVAVALA